MPSQRPRRSKLHCAIRPIIEKLEGRKYLSFEGETYSNSITLFDSGTEGGNSFSIDWGDGSSGGQDGDPSGETNLSLEHYYDNNTSLTVTEHYFLTGGGWDAQVFGDAILNVQPTADFHFQIDNVTDGSVTASLTNATDVSVADQNAGLRFSFALSPQGLEDNWFEASTSSTATFDYSPGTVVYGRVIDQDFGYSDFSSAGVEFPTINSPAIAPNGVTLSWLDVTDGDAVNYRIRRSDDGGQTYDWVRTLSPTATSYVDTTVTPGQSYVYIVRAIGGANYVGQTPFSLGLDVDVPDFPSPSGLSVTEASPTTAVLNWSDESDFEDGFLIFRSNDEGGTWTKIADVAEDATTYTATVSDWSIASVFQVKGYIGTANSPVLVSEPSMATPIQPDVPTIVTQPTSPNNPLTGKTTTLSILGGGVDRGASHLTYTWSVVSKPPEDPSDPTFSNNGTNAGKNTTATFFAKGTYKLACTVNNAGETVESNEITVVVNQTKTSIVVDAGDGVIDPDANPLTGASAKELDQFGIPMATQPTFTWTTQTSPEQGHWQMEDYWGTLQHNVQRIDLTTDPVGPNQKLIWKYTGLPAHSAVRLVIQATMGNPNPNAVSDWDHVVLEATANGVMLPSHRRYNDDTSGWISWVPTAEASLSTSTTTAESPYQFIVDDSGELTVTMKLTNSNDWRFSVDEQPLVNLQVYAPNSPTLYAGKPAPLPPGLATKYITLQASADGFTAKALVTQARSEKYGPYTVRALPTAVNVLNSYPIHWFNKVNARVTPAEAFLSGKVEDSGIAFNTLLGMVPLIEFTFAAEQLVNGTGADVALFTNSIWSPGDQVLISCDYNGFGSELSNNGNWANTGVFASYFNTYYGYATTSGAAQDSGVLISAFNLSDLGVPLGAEVRSIRLRDVGASVALLGIGSLNIAPPVKLPPDLSVDSNNDGNVDTVPSGSDDIIEADAGAPGAIISEHGPLVPMTLTAPPGMTSGTLTLSVNAIGASQVLVWSAQTGGSLLLTGSVVSQDFNVSTFVDGKMTVWLEGIRSSEVFGDVEFTLTANLPAGAIPVGPDTITATVVGGVLAVDANRDGTVSFNSKDSTSASNPYRFWLNNDSDSATDDVIGGAPDSQNTTISTIRDLEDFSRLQLRFPNVVNLTDPNWQVRLKFTNLSGAPAIRVFSALGPGADYLTNSQIAGQQIARLSPYPRHVVISTSNGDLEKSYVADNNHDIYMLFEGVTAGAGSLSADLYYNGYKVRSQTVNLDLRDIKKLYEHWTVGDTATWGNVRNPATPKISATAFLTGDSAPVSDRKAYSNDFIVFVHGWRMTPSERRSFAETAYKRLYWQGYKGRFALYSWPTEWMNTEAIIGQWPNVFDTAVRANYNNSEMKAYASSLGLRKLLKGLDASGYTVNLLAHSMGNIVASEALRYEATSNDADKQIVRTYVASEAASTGSAYDKEILNPLNPNSIANRLHANYGWLPLLDAFPPTPDIYGTFVPNNGNAYFSMIGLAAQRIYNFFNPTDGAVGDANAWAFSQAMKPMVDPQQRYSYGYDGTRYYEIDTQTNIRRNLDLTKPEGRWTAFAYAAEAKSKGLGVLAGVGGPFRTNGEVDLSTAFGGALSSGNFTSTRADHSAPFNSDLTHRFKYWNLLMQRFGITPLNPITPSSGVAGRP